MRFEFKPEDFYGLEFLTSHMRDDKHTENLAKLSATLANKKLTEWLNQDLIICDLCEEAIKKDEEKFK